VPFFTALLLIWALCVLWRNGPYHYRLYRNNLAKSWLFAKNQRKFHTGFAWPICRVYANAERTRAAKDRFG
jgi:hypothetical protein